jgi:hypothetical protein
MGSRIYTIRDTNPETRKMYDWAINYSIPSPSLKNDIKELVKESIHEARFANDKNQVIAAKHYLSTKLSKYIISKYIITFNDDLEEMRKYADYPSDENLQKELERDNLISEMAERAFRNICYPVLADAIYVYYESKLND